MLYNFQINMICLKIFFHRHYFYIIGCSSDLPMVAFMFVIDVHLVHVYLQSNFIKNYLLTCSFSSKILLLLYQGPQVLNNKLINDSSVLNFYLDEASVKIRSFRFCSLRSLIKVVCFLCHLHRQADTSGSLFHCLSLHLSVHLSNTL